jgi:hypothetical protein
MGEHTIQKQGPDKYAVGKGEGAAFEVLHVFPSEGEALLQVKYLDEQAEQKQEDKQAQSAKEDEEEGLSKREQKVPHPKSHAGDEDEPTKTSPGRARTR